MLLVPDKGRVSAMLRNRQGVTLFELLIAVVLLGMVSTMIYSVLNVGINFSARGGKHLERLAREKNLLSLLRRQVNGAWYDPRFGKVLISGGGDGVLRLVTRQPLLHRSAGTVLAVYRVNEAEQALYYLEKIDYFNAEYGEKYLPDFSEMEKMYGADRPVTLVYEPQTSMVSVSLGGEEFAFFPKCLPSGARPNSSGTGQ
ncbi:MAG: prepilin-type N-terminal cleavage/methylation domain-containing protein [Pseudomonadota bacterium]